MRDFLRLEAAGGIVLMLSAVLAMFVPLRGPAAAVAGALPRMERRCIPEWSSAS